MPELPEVEALAADLRVRVVGRHIERVDVSAISALKTFDPPPTALYGRLVTDAGRYGKFLDIICGPDENGPQENGPDGSGKGETLHLIVHLARAGWLHYRDAMPATLLKPGKGPIALRVRLDNGGGFDLTEQGTQKKLAAYLVRDPKEVPGVSRLGPDALGLDLPGFAARIRSRRGQIKGVLTDQEVLAGIGNAYSDEILHRARLSPFAMSDRLTDETMQTLYEATRSALTDAVERSVGQGAASLKGEKRSGLVVHARTGLPCPICGDLIREVSFADKSLQYCPTCQTGGRPLADRRLSKLLR
jgi:formamidopyrimidine-DNA glycosylase